MNKQDLISFFVFERLDTKGKQKKKQEKN